MHNVPIFSLGNFAYFYFCFVRSILLIHEGLLLPLLNFLSLRMAILELRGPVFLAVSSIPAYLPGDPYKQIHEESELGLPNCRILTHLFGLLGSWTQSFHGAQRLWSTSMSLISSTLLINMTFRTSLMCVHLNQMYQKVVICVLQKPGFLVPWCIVPEENIGMVKKALFISSWSGHWQQVPTAKQPVLVCLANLAHKLPASSMSSPQAKVHMILLLSHKGHLPFPALPGQACHS